MKNKPKRIENFLFRVTEIASTFPTETEGGDIEIVS